MTKEDEARLAKVRDDIGELGAHAGEWVDEFLLRLLDEVTAERDEQAARVADAQAECDALGERLVTFVGASARLIVAARRKDVDAYAAALTELDAAIRARAGSPAPAWAANSPGLREGIRWVDHYLRMPLKEDVRASFEDLRKRMAHEAEYGPTTSVLMDRPVAPGEVKP